MQFVFICQQSFQIIVQFILYVYSPFLRIGYFLYVYIYVVIFFRTTLSLKKDRTSSILTFSNKSVKLFTLKNCFLIAAKALHSIRICLTVQVVWHVKHCGCGSCFSMKAWVSLVWPMRNRDITTCSLLHFLKAGLRSPKVDWIWESLVWMFMSHRCCHFFVKEFTDCRFQIWNGDNFRA